MTEASGPQTRGFLLRTLTPAHLISSVMCSLLTTNDEDVVNILIYLMRLVVYLSLSISVLN